MRSLAIVSLALCALVGAQSNSSLIDGQVAALRATGIALNSTPIAYLRIDYSNGTSANLSNITTGQQLTPTQTARVPTLYLTNLTEALNETKLLVVLFDPDAPTPQNASSSDILHWGAYNLSIAEDGRLVNGTAFAPYSGPKPPQGSDPHRYIFYVVEQGNASLPEAFRQLPATIGRGRTGINVTQILAAADLSNVIGASFIRAAYDGSSIYSSSSSSAASTTQSSSSSTASSSSSSVPSVSTTSTAPVVIPTSTVYATTTISPGQPVVVTQAIVVAVSTLNSISYTTVIPSSVSSTSSLAPPPVSSQAGSASRAITSVGVCLAALLAMLAR